MESNIQSTTNEISNKPTILPNQTTVKILFGINKLYLPEDSKFESLEYTPNGLYLHYNYSITKMVLFDIRIYTQKELIENQVWSYSSFASFSINGLQYFGVIKNNGTT